MGEWGCGIRRGNGATASRYNSGFPTIQRRRTHIGGGISEYRYPPPPASAPAPRRSSILGGSGQYNLIVGGGNQCPYGSEYGSGRAKWHRCKSEGLLPLATLHGDGKQWKCYPATQPSLHAAGRYNSTAAAIASATPTAASAPLSSTPAAVAAANSRRQHHYHQQQQQQPNRSNHGEWSLSRI